MLETRMRAWQWLLDALWKGDKAIEKQALDGSPQGARGREKPKKTWKRTVLGETGKCGKTMNEVKRMTGNRVRWRNFTNSVFS
jgi:hypothetical protein